MFRKGSIPYAGKDMAKQIIISQNRQSECKDTLEIDLGKMITDDLVITRRQNANEEGKYEVSLDVTFKVKDNYEFDTEEESIEFYKLMGVLPYRNKR